LCSTNFGELACGNGIPLNTWSSPRQVEDWDWWQVVLIAGTTYTIEVEREDCNLDTISRIYSGDSTANDFNVLTYRAGGGR
jgi:hypothetical protein